MTNFISNLSAKLREPKRELWLIWGATIVVIIITFLTTFYKVRQAPQTLALHYNVVIGVDVLGSRNRLYQVPLTAVAITFINYLLVRLLRLRQHFLPLLLASLSLTCALILLAATLFLFQVN